MKKALIKGLGIMIMIFLYMICFPVSAVSGSPNSLNVVDIETSAGEYLFDVKNLKPGDWAPRTIVVKNNGEQDFTYVTSIENTGPEKLFGELLLEVSDSSGEIYNGKLVDFNGLGQRSLAVGSEEELHLTVRVPEHLGNDYQGLDAKFLLQFTAEGKPVENNDEDENNGETPVDKETGGDGTSGGSELPDTATNMFNLLLGGGGLLLAGGSLYLLQRNRKADKKHS
ncbi:LPXTG-motif cell wall-anchored protein [Salirhabdus euzebyi]|uniref:LPXTG-motif cell wall-anchored protein n=1 Tax=Salirhabdus euzebyi TaxID=394506 RepID=A0A841Q5T7_9BACI|nr:LPXTG-motif cell wall-anchored protein [Salirhabdus euzebyi]